ncbi:hypothetical protein ABSL23_12940 [Halobacterium sp. NMX12-1]|uniref:DUF8130 domain-containing protein n=1 Tax=Halobacterium sp. NMX12-1 TaxID=3166650 RepID=A0AAU8CAX4_9EURY
MNRRTYLGTLAAAALAGCTGAPAGDTPDDTSDFPYTLTNVQTDDPPVENATIDVTVTAQFTTDHPARLEVAFTNDADDARTFTFGSLVPWDAIRGTREDGDATLLLSPDAGVTPEEPSDDCWQATDGVALPAVMREETLDPGETASREFRVLAAHDSEECHPTGTYRFEDDNYLGEGWRFSLNVVSEVEN